MGKEVRRVPEGWQHPMTYDSRLRVPVFVSLLQRSMAEDVVEWSTCMEEYDEEECGSVPVPEEYMPTGEWFQLFETVSEGSPLSPSFETGDELAAWLAEHGDFYGTEWTAEQAEAMVRVGWAPSLYFDGSEVYESHEIPALQEAER